MEALDWYQRLRIIHLLRISSSEPKSLKSVFHSFFFNFLSKMNKITQLVQSHSQTLENSHPLDTVLKYVNGYTKRGCTKYKLLLTMICRLNLEKSVFKLMQNLTSRLQCNGFVSSRKVFSSCSW